MAEPGKPLTDEQVDEIIEAYADLEDKQDVESKLEYSYASVRKYVDRALEEGDPRLEHCDGWQSPSPDPESFTGDGPGASPYTARDPSDIPDWTGKSPGDFLKEFFDEFEVGLKQRWVEIQARRADRRDRLPSRESLLADILNMNSGINQQNFQEASYIVDEYWAAAQEYLKQTGRQVNHESISGQQQPAYPGYVGQPPGGMGMGVGTPPGMGVGFGRGMGGSQMPGLQSVQDELSRLRQELDGVKGDGASGDSKSSMVERWKELREQKELINELSGTDEQVERIEQQISSLESRLAQDAQSEGVPMAGGSGDFEEQLLLLAATRDDIDLNRVIDALEKVDGAHKPPEILRLEREMDIKEAEIEHEQERTEKLGQLAETLMEKLGEGFARKITEGNDTALATTESSEGDTDDEVSTDAPEALTHATDGAGPEHPGQGHAAAVPAAAKSPGCPHCGAEMTRGTNSAVCPECEHGIAPCDLCTSPVEIPPIGEAEHARCAECENVLAVPDDGDGEVECPDCGWAGDTDALRGEFLTCDSCGSLRPIQRREQLEQQAAAVDEFLGGD